MQDFRRLIVWQRSHQLALLVYKITKSFPVVEQFGLTSQLRRAATSVPTNLVEGSKRRQRRDYARFVNIAEGSLAEVEYLLLLSQELGYFREDPSELFQTISEIAKMLNSLHARLCKAAQAPEVTPILSTTNY